MPDVGLAVVLGELIGREDEFFVGFVVVGPVVGFVEAVHDQGAVDLDGLVPLVAIEHQPGAEAAGGRGAALVQDRVAPDGHDLGRRLRIIRAGPRPETVFGQVELGATRHRGEDCRQQEQIG